MQDIKFKAYAPELRKTVDVFAVNPMNQTVYLSSVHLFGTPGDDVLMKYGDEPDQVKLRRYTGLKDKNGVEIFEGDILAVKFNGQYVERISWKGKPDAIAEVYWDYSAFRFNCHGEKDRRYADFQDFLDETNWHDDHGLVMASIDHTEVVGNIHETPDLLTKAA